MFRHFSTGVFSWLMSGSSRFWSVPEGLQDKTLPISSQSISYTLSCIIYNGPTCCVLMYCTVVENPWHRPRCFYYYCASAFVSITIRPCRNRCLISHRLTSLLSSRPPPPRTRPPLSPPSRHSTHPPRLLPVTLHPRRHHSISPHPAPAANSPLV